MSDSSEWRLTRARSFDDTATAYEFGRPGYPVGVIDWWQAHGAFPASGTVLDLAAGTGKLTRELLGRATTVIAVEPLPNMRAELARVLPNVRLLDGTAEHIPLDDDSVDSVFVAQAFHWFDPLPALTEIHRVLRPGGGLGLVWNDDDPERRTDWMEQISRMKLDAGGGTIRQGVVAAVAAVSTGGLFTTVEHHAEPWTEPTTAARVEASVLSRSYVSVLDPEEREVVLAPLRAVLDAAPQPLLHPHLANTFWCRAM